MKTGTEKTVGSHFFQQIDNFDQILNLKLILRPQKMYAVAKI